MKRFDYRRGRFERIVGFALPATVPVALRQSLIMLALTAMAALFGCIVQAVRFDDAQRDTQRLSRREAEIAVGLSRTRSLVDEVAELQTVARHLDDVRGSGPLHASDVAAIGNALPADVWLTSLRFGPGGVTLDGRAARVASVAAAISAIVRVPGYGVARLIAMHAEPPTFRVTYQISLEARR